MNDTQTQGVAAVGFLVLAFTEETAGDKALQAIKAAKKQQQIYFEDAAVISQDAQGKVHYHETGDMSAGKGAGIGALVGGVLGILVGPAWASWLVQAPGQQSARPFRPLTKGSRTRI